MLRDEALRMAGAARGHVLPFPTPEPDLSPAEKAWIHTCQAEPAARASEFSGVPGITTRALERCALAPAHLAALRRHGWLGRRPRSGTIDRLLWDEAMVQLDAQLRTEGVTH